MLLTSPYGDVEFKDLSQYKNIGINLSGGADSALVLFIMCKLFDGKSNTLFPITIVQKRRPRAHEHSQMVIKLIQNRFPNSNIGEHQVLYYDKTDKTATVRSHRKFEKALIVAGTIDFIVHGKTSNPSTDEQQKHDMVHGRLDFRDKIPGGYPTFLPDRITPKYIPWRNVDKRFIAHQYKKFDMMDDIFPVTASCDGNEHETDWFSKPCKTCWWCKEKFWAFGYYDGGVI